MLSIKAQNTSAGLRSTAALAVIELFGQGGGKGSKI
jgi:hypothetical protein